MGLPMLKRVARAFVHQVLRPSRVRRTVELELAARRTAARAERLDPALAGRVFVDRHGTTHPLDPGLRDRLKPQWRTMCDPIAVARPPTDETLATRARNAVKVVAEARSLVATVAGTELAGRILEVGCYDGSAAYQLARGPGTTVTGSDLARYYVSSRPGAVSDAEIGAQESVLAGIRDRARMAASRLGAADGDRGDFVEDDITTSRLEPASFDAIVSFEVLEHVLDPAAAFQAIGRLLKPGGVTYHDYNPFFSANGGHSLCTLDLPWGHARLDDQDVERYLHEIRPAEEEQALRFYREGLNRMTLADLRDAVSGAGLELLAVIPWTDRKLVGTLSDGTLADVRRTYPTAVAADLLATFVAVIARRPMTPGSDPSLPDQPR